jgi:hypothetical protein
VLSAAEKRCSLVFIRGSNYKQASWLSVFFVVNSNRRFWAEKGALEGRIQNSGDRIGTATYLLLDTTFSMVGSLHV